jgi:hypothetical protein
MSYTPKHVVYIEHGTAKVTLSVPTMAREQWHLLGLFLARLTALDAAPQATAVISTTEVHGDEKCSVVTR